MVVGSKKLRFRVKGVGFRVRSRGPIWDTALVRLAFRLLGNMCQTTINPER